jgi:hypothetical protein
MPVTGYTSTRVHLRRLRASKSPSRGNTLQQATAGSTADAGNHIGLLGVLGTGLWQGRARGACGGGSDARVAGWDAGGCGGVAPGDACAQEVAVVGVEGLGGIAVPCLLQGAQTCGCHGSNNGDRTHKDCQ